MPWMPRQSPALPSTHPKLVRRVKPLYRLSERETAAFAFLRKIDYIVEECPFAAGATSITHKEILSRLEDASPGAKHNFLFGFLEKARPAFERRKHALTGRGELEVPAPRVGRRCRASHQPMRRL